MSSNSVLCELPTDQSIAKYIPEGSLGYYITPCQIIRLECKDLRVRKKEEIDKLLLEALTVTDHLGAINSKVLHSVFGIGVNLARSLMQMMEVRDLIAPMDPLMISALENVDFEGFTFPDEQTKRHKDDPYDYPWSLTDEGLRTFEEKSFEPPQLENRDLFFIEPGGLMISSVEGLMDLKWEDVTDEYDIEELRKWFLDSERERRNIPDIIYGIVLEKKEVLDDFKQVIDTLPPTKVQVFRTQPIDRGIWRISFLDGEIIEPSRSQVRSEIYWYGSRKHPMPHTYKEEKEFKPSNGRIGTDWKVNIPSKICKPEQIQEAIQSRGRVFLPLNIDDPPFGYLPTSNIPSQLIEAYDPKKKGTIVRTEIIPLPTNTEIENWAFLSMDELHLPSDGLFTRERMSDLLDELYSKLYDAWDTGVNSTILQRLLEKSLTIEVYLKRQRMNGNWLIGYRLDEEEVFKDAV